MPIKLTTSEKVKIELSRKKMTQKELAEKLGVKEMTVSQRISSNSWKEIEIYFMRKELGFDI